MIEGLQIGLDAVNMLHLQFADNTILFCPARYETLANYRRILDCFGVMSGLRINYDKSALVPINYGRELVHQVKRVLGCLEVSLPITYLGIPLGANPKRLHTWQPVIDKIRKMLSGWKVNALSKASWLVLIKSVLNNLSMYYLGLFTMPKAVAKEIISMQRRFF